LGPVLVSLNRQPVFCYLEFAPWIDVSTLGNVSYVMKRSDPCDSPIAQPIFCEESCARIDMSAQCNPYSGGLEGCAI
jgi:hypothetical protein